MIPRNKEDLLNTRLCDLGLTFQSSKLAHFGKRLLRELDNKEISKLKPKIYLGDEWFCPDETLAISVPFYLANNRLMKMQNIFVGNVEGESSGYFMRLLRHECGHAFDHAYGIANLAEFSRIFGNPTKPYTPDQFKPLKNLDDFVENLDEGYASAHPLEDFAETFAVWLNPFSKWQTTYQNKPTVLKKLAFIKKVVFKYGRQEPKAKRGPTMGDVQRLKSKLVNYYACQKRQLN